MPLAVTVINWYQCWNLLVRHGPWNVCLSLVVTQYSHKFYVSKLLTKVFSTTVSRHMLKSPFSTLDVAAITFRSKCVLIMSSTFFNYPLASEFYNFLKPDHCQSFLYPMIHWWEVDQSSTSHIPNTIDTSECPSVVRWTIYDSYSHKPRLTGLLVIQIQMTKESSRKFLLEKFVTDKCSSKVFCQQYTSEVLLLSVIHFSPKRPDKMPYYIVSDW